MKTNRYDLFSWYYQYKQMIIDFFNTTGKYIDKKMIGEILMMDTVGVISADDGIRWISPDGNYKFEVIRTDNQLWISDKSSNYIMTLRIYSSLGNMLTEIRYNEFDTVRIIDSAINGFLNEFYGNEESMSIYINPSNPRLITHIIQLDNIFEDTPKYQAYSYDGKEIEEIMVKILQYNSYPTETVIPIVLMRLSLDQFEDFIYKLFFCTILDIEIGPEYGQAMDIIGY